MAPSNSISRFAVAIVAAAVTSGCATPVAHMTGPFIGGPKFKDYERVGERVTAMSCDLLLLFGLIPSGKLDFNKAYEKAMADAPAEATGLSAVNFSLKTFLIPVIGYSICVEASGIPAIRTLRFPDEIDQRLGPDPRHGDAMEDER